MEHDRNGTLHVVWSGGDRFDIKVRHHTIRIDESMEFGGSDTGPAPVELFIGSLAACVAHRAERYLRRCQLPAGVRVTADYEMGLRPAHVSRIELIVEAPGVPEGLRESFCNVIRHSAVDNSLRLQPETTYEIRIADGVETLGTRR
ncbi:OsmC family protein [Sphaerisporangium album]|uniref:OsmC family protein n=1 Tax=Sphaerisporangium album TaxID=509200 RepID=UPI001C688BDD|nr:OsmC family protein [Sphaerisporangium album]